MCIPLKICFHIGGSFMGVVGSFVNPDFLSVYSTFPHLFIVIVFAKLFLFLIVQVQFFVSSDIDLSFLNIFFFLGTTVSIVDFMSSASAKYSPPRLTCCLRNFPADFPGISRN